LIAATVLVIAAASLLVPRVRTAIGVSEQVNRDLPIDLQQPVSEEPLTVSVTDAGDYASLRRLAEKGDPAAQFAVGARFATGEDVKQDYGEAARWFSMAAERGHIAAQATLGAYYWAGRGVPQDLAKAYFWSVLAQNGGDQAGKYRLAILTSRMTRSQVLTAQQEANDWLKHRQRSGKPSAQIR
jgi:TPR repeat protein